MNPFDNFGMLFQGIQTNSLFANIPSFNIGTNLKAKQPMLTMPNLVNMQASYNGASAIDNVFDSNQTTNNPVAQFNSMMPQIGAMNNFWSPFSSSTMSGIGLPPTPNLSGLGSAPTSAAPFMISMGIAMGLIDPASVGISATSGTQSTNSQAATIKKMPIISAAKTKQIVTQPIETKVMWGGVYKDASLLSTDDSKLSLLNAALPDDASKTEFITSLSADIDKEVRLAERGASKDVVAEVFASKLYSLYEKKNPENAKYIDSKQKEKILAGLKDICTGKDIETTGEGKYNKFGQAQYNENVQAALQVLPGLSNKENNPNNTWGGGIGGGWGGGGWFGGGMFGGGGFITQGGSKENPVFQILQQTTDSLTATAKDNLIARNSMG